MNIYNILINSFYPSKIKKYNQLVKLKKILYKNMQNLILSLDNNEKTKLLFLLNKLNLNKLNLKQYQNMIKKIIFTYDFNKLKYTNQMENKSSETMISCVIIDDEKPAREALDLMLSRYFPEKIKDLAKAESLKEGIFAIYKNHAQPAAVLSFLVFVDFNLNPAIFGQFCFNKSRSRNAFFVFFRCFFHTIFFGRIYAQQSKRFVYCGVKTHINFKMHGIAINQALYFCPIIIGYNLCSSRLFAVFFA